MSSQQTSTTAFRRRASTKAAILHAGRLRPFSVQRAVLSGRRLTMKPSCAKMVGRQKNMKIPTELVPVCPHCGRPMTMNLRCDDTFVQDEGWHKAAERYEKFLRTRKDQRIVFLELGVGYNTPGHYQIPLLAHDGAGIPRPFTRASTSARPSQCGRSRRSQCFWTWTSAKHCGS